MFACLLQGKGYVNSTDGLCTCISGYHGSSCQYSEFDLSFCLSIIATKLHFLILQSIALSGSRGSLRPLPAILVPLRIFHAQIWYTIKLFIVY